MFGSRRIVLAALAFAVVVAACSSGHRLPLARGGAGSVQAGPGSGTDATTSTNGVTSTVGSTSKPHAAAGHVVAGTPARGAELAASKIQHVIVIMQENRSFDTYFGTYPGANGFPAANGHFTVCVPDPAHHTCVYPSHLTADSNSGGPHSHGNAVADVDGGKMDGFIGQAERSQSGCASTNAPNCSGTAQSDVMGYHDAREIPNYWTWAHDFVLQDNLFEPNSSWSLPQHLFLVSEWSARCTSPDPMSCTNAVQAPANPPDYPSANGPPPPPDYAWTDLTYLLHKNDVSWRYYVQGGTEPDCQDDAASCGPVSQSAKTPGIWNPLPYFETVHQDGQLANVTDASNYFRDARTGNLPTVSWITPSNENSEHPTAKVSVGQAWVTGLIDAAMTGPEWNSTAVFLSWDDWGVFYDHVVPPVVDQNGYGLRVPGLVISPYAKAGFIDNQVLSHDAYVKLIEDLFLGGVRIDPASDGRPDPRPDVRENLPQLGTLLSDFDFSQPPRPPVPLPVHPPPGPPSTPGG